MVIKNLRFIISTIEEEITHMWRRWGTPQNFLLTFIDELWKTRKIRILKKWKKIAGDIIILRMCTKNHNHMRYSSWNTEKDKFFVILGHFFALYKTLQKCQEISSFYTCVPKVMIRWCTVPQTWCATDGRTDGRTEKVTYGGGCPTWKRQLHHLKCLK